MFASKTHNVGDASDDDDDDGEPGELAFDGAEVLVIGTDDDDGEDDDDEIAVELESPIREPEPAFASELELPLARSKAEECGPPPIHTRPLRASAQRTGVTGDGRRLISSPRSVSTTKISVALKDHASLLETATLATKGDGA